MFLSENLSVILANKLKLLYDFIKKNNKLIWSFFTKYVQGCHSVRKSQEKLKKMTKVRKSQKKMGGCEKKSGKVRKFDKIKKKVRFCQFKFTKFLVFQSLQMVKISLKSEKNSKIFLEIYKNI